MYLWLWFDERGAPGTSPGDPRAELISGLLLEGGGDAFRKKTGCVCLQTQKRVLSESSRIPLTLKCGRPYIYIGFFLFFSLSSYGSREGENFFPLFSRYECYEVLVW
jgi:hypothetical protein